MMERQVVCAREEMLTQISRIEDECFSSPWSVEMLRRQLDPKENIFLAAVEGDRVLGYVGLTFVLDEGYISNVAVAPEYRRQGVAVALMDGLLRQAKEKKLAFMTLEARETNLGAIALYEKLGYKKVGCRKGYYEKPREDAILMTLEIEK